MTRVAVLQSNYLPWRGYFDLIARSDEFVIYDSCQYTVNDWRNRNLVKTRQGTVWLTVPVLTKGRTGQLIEEAVFGDRAWIAKHRRTIEQSMARAPHFGVVDAVLGRSFERLGASDRLHDVNTALIREVSGTLGISTNISVDREYGDLVGGPSEKVAELAARVGATSYVTGPRGLDYLEAGPFTERGIAIEVIDYSTLRPYPQLFGDFDGALTVLDLLANTGTAAAEHLTSTVRSVELIDGSLVPGDVIGAGRRAE